MQSTSATKEMEETELAELSEKTARQLSKVKGEPEWLLQARLEALRAFEQLPMPQLSYGLHVSSQLQIDLKQLRPLECVTSNKAYEENGVIVEDLSAAAAKYEDVLKPVLMNNKDNKGSKCFQNKLEALHAAFWNNGIFIYAPKGNGRKGSERRDRGNSKQKVRSVKLFMRQKPTDIAKVVVVAEENVNVEVIETLASAETAETSDREGKEGLVKGPAKEYMMEVVDVAAKPGAAVKFASVQKLGSNVNSLVSRKADVGNAANVDWIDISIGGLRTRQEVVSLLNGEGAASNTFGAFFGDGAQHLDIMAKSVHNARNTTSNIRIKGALKGKAKAIIQSFTKIMSNAANSAGHQKANVLLLSGTASASPIPKLEIDNYDVKASHEASVGQLDKEKLFYLMSRGLNYEESVKLVVEGFFEPLLREIRLKGLADGLRQTISARIEGIAESGSD